MVKSYYFCYNIKDNKMPRVIKKNSAIPMLHSSKTAHTRTEARIRPFGNSNGIILSNKIMEAAGLQENADVIITVDNSHAIIIQAKTGVTVNSNLNSWDAGFKDAIKKGRKPESDLFNGLTNEFEQNEW